ncbi:hypothetical protein ACL02T_24495 [Pseudonocardia sp. RS010]|uniref:hypothetical protein n=1 Tax=Pseudonocardia sp. RS010 TaxID=3385979 RepID=UPI0039A1FDBE
MCLLVGLLLFGPRVVDVLWWLLDPVRWDATFGTVLWPIIGIVFLPLTTLIYVLVAPGGIAGLDAVWLALAFLVDLSGYAGGRRYGRRRSVAA